MRGRAWQLQQALADLLKDEGLFDNPSTEAAFRSVPRHLFLPGIELEKVYSDGAIGTKFLQNGLWISSSSQPTMMAIMLDQLALRPGDRVLEIGAGTGYNAAIMAHIVGEAGQVISLDIDEDIVSSARAHLQAASVRNVQALQADGIDGYSADAPYDRIVLTVGAEDIAPAWCEQLAPGGRLVLPLELAGHSTMVSVAFDSRGDHLESCSVRACGFMMLRGAGGDDPYKEPAAPTPEIYLAPFDERAVDSAAVARELTKESREFASGVSAAPWQLERDIRFWLARLGMECFVLCHRQPSADEAAWGESSLGVMQKGALCRLLSVQSQSDPNQTMQIRISCYGDAASLAQEIMESLHQWQAADSPSAESIRIRAYPARAANIPGDAQIVIEKPFTRLLLNWEAG